MTVKKANFYRSDSGSCHYVRLRGELDAILCWSSLRFLWRGLPELPVPLQVCYTVDRREAHPEAYRFKPDGARGVHVGRRCFTLVGVVEERLLRTVRPGQYFWAWVLV